jgi:hypothetical protein
MVENRLMRESKKYYIVIEIPSLFIYFFIEYNLTGKIFINYNYIYFLLFNLIEK